MINCPKAYLGHAIFLKSVISHKSYVNARLDFMKQENNDDLLGASGG